MAYLINGVNIERLAETKALNDRRTATGFSSSPYLFSGNTYETATSKKFIMNYTGYMYSGDCGVGAKLHKQNTEFFSVSKKGCRPLQYKKWDTSSSGIYFLTKFSDGEIWVGNTALSRSGTRIATAEEDINYMYVMQISGGGGGAGSNSTKSGGGGGGGSFAFNCIKIMPNMVHRFVLHPGGASGGVNANGRSGGDCSCELYRDTNYGSSGIYSFWLHGGGAGTISSSGSGGSKSSYSPTSNSYITLLDYYSGASGGGAGSSGGGHSNRNTTAYNPENVTSNYGSSSGGGGNIGGGGGGGWYYGHDGGKGGAGYENGGNGGIGAGGGGSAWVLFSGRSGGSGGNSYCALFY